MKVETRETDQGTEIIVETDQKVAIAVKTGDGERIYLPETEGDDSSYYVENTSGLTRVEGGYAVLHQGSVEDIELIG